MKALRNQLEWVGKAQAVLTLYLAVALMLFYVVGYRPENRRLAELQMQIETKRRSLDLNSARVQILPDVVMKVNELRARVDRYDKRLPRQQELGQFIRDLNGMVHDAALRGLTVQPGVPVRSGL